MDMDSVTLISFSVALAAYFILLIRKFRYYQKLIFVSVIHFALLIPLFLWHAIDNNDNLISFLFIYNLIIWGALIVNFILALIVYDR